MADETKSRTDVAKEAAANVQVVVRDAARDAVEKAQEAGGKALDTAKKRASELTTSQKVAVGVGAVGAAVAGIAALRMAARKIAKGKNSVYHLEPADDGWRLRLESAEKAEVLFETKQEGLDAARDLVSERAPSQLVVHLADGSEQTRHSYEAS